MAFCIIYSHSIIIIIDVNNSVRQAHRATRADSHWMKLKMSTLRPKKIA